MYNALEFSGLHSFTAFFPLWFFFYFTVVYAPYSSGCHCRYSICPGWVRVHIDHPFLSFFVSFFQASQLLAVVCRTTSPPCTLVFLWTTYTKTISTSNVNHTINQYYNQYTSLLYCSYLLDALTSHTTSNFKSRSTSGAQSKHQDIISGWNKKVCDFKHTGKRTG